MTGGKKTRSPIRSQPRREAGQGAQEEGTFRVAAGVIGPVVGVVSVWAVVGVTWLTSLRTGEVTIGGVAGWAGWISLVLVVIGVWHVRGAAAFFKGAKGERAVRDALDRLRPLGYEAVHDIVLKNGDVTYNIDHVLVGPGGVFALETKYRRKPVMKGTPKVEFNGEAVRVQVSQDGFGPWDEGPVRQARAARDSVRRIVRERTGMDVPVRAVVVYPGWYGSDRKDCDVWVMGENFFLGAVRLLWKKGQRPTVDPKDLKRVVGVLGDVGEH